MVPFPLSDATLTLAVASGHTLSKVMFTLLSECSLLRLTDFFFPSGIVCVTLGSYRIRINHFILDETLRETFPRGVKTRKQKSECHMFRQIAVRPSLLPLSDQTGNEPETVDICSAMFHVTHKAKKTRNVVYDCVKGQMWTETYLTNSRSRTAQRLDLMVQMWQSCFNLSHPEWSA